MSAAGRTPSSTASRSHIDSVPGIRAWRVTSLPFHYFDSFDQRLQRRQCVQAPRLADESIGLFFLAVRKDYSKKGRPPKDRSLRLQ